MLKTKNSQIFENGKASTKIGDDIANHIIWATVATRGPAPFLRARTAYPRQERRSWDGRHASRNVIATDSDHPSARLARDRLNIKSPRRGAGSLTPDRQAATDQGGNSRGTADKVRLSARVGKSISSGQGSRSRLLRAGG
jgi:hypothetical protein